MPLADFFANHPYLAYADGVLIGYFSNPMCAARSAIIQAGYKGSPVVIGPDGQPENMDALRRRILDKDAAPRIRGAA